MYSCVDMGAWVKIHKKKDMEALYVIPVLSTVQVHVGSYSNVGE